MLFAPRSIGAFFLLAAAGCATLQSRRPITLGIEIDSAKYSGYHFGIAHLGGIPFKFTNTTGNPISSAGCGGPRLPGFEKLIDGKWVGVLDKPTLLCRIIPDFYIAAGKSMSGVADYYAFDPGHRIEPELRMDSVGGTYRLVSSWTLGLEAGKPKARSVVFRSKPFRLVEYPVYTPVDSTLVRRLTDGIEQELPRTLNLPLRMIADSFHVVVADSLHPYWIDARRKIVAKLQERLTIDSLDRRGELKIGIPRRDSTEWSVEFSISLQHRCDTGFWTGTQTNYLVRARPVRQPEKPVTWALIDVKPTMFADPVPCELTKPKKE